MSPFASTQGRGNRGGQWGQLAPTTLESWLPPQLSIGLKTVGAVVVPKLGVVGHKRKLNGGKHFSEKSTSFIGSLIWQIKLNSRLRQRYILSSLN